MRRDGGTESGAAWAMAVLALIAGAVAYLQSQFRWFHPFIDAGRDLYIPGQLARGARLYHDVLYFYPPLAPWLLALVPSKSLAAYAVFGAVLAALTGLTIWLLVRWTADDTAAGAALLLFLSLNACGTGGFGANWFFPYAHAATLGMLLFLAGAACLYRRIPEAGTALMLAAAWTKIEFVVFGAAVVGLALIRLDSSATTRERRRHFLSTAVYAVLLAGSIVKVLGDPILRANILPPSLLGGHAARFFYAQVSGVAEWKANLLLSLEGALLIAAAVLLLRHFEKHRVAVTAAMLVLALLLANPSFFRAWTLLQIALLPSALRRPRSPLAFLLLLSIAGSSRIWLNLAPSWYGFVFTVPLEVLIAYVLFAWLPERGIYTIRAAKLWLPVFVAVAISGLLAAHVAYDGARPVHTARGTYFDTSSTRAAEVSALLGHLQKSGARELVVMPEGLAINYLSGVPTPMRFHTFTPVELEGNEAAALRDLQRAHPERIALVPRDVTEFGSSVFGRDYAQGIVSWMRGRYEVEARFGEIVLLKRMAR